MGPTKLSEIREQIRRAIAETGEDPLVWLEKQIKSAKRKTPREGTEVLSSLKRLLEENGKGKRSKVAPGTKKNRGAVQSRS